MRCIRRFVAPAVLLGVLPAASVHAQQPHADGIRMVELDGRAVRVQVLGLETRRAGSPVVVFEAGATNGLEVWGDITRQVAAGAAVVAYDRAGLGRSEWDDVRPTPQHVTARLHRLLQQIGAPPPYVLVGYSWGGVLARYFAAEHPGDVHGIVFVDPAPIVTQPLADNLAAFHAIGAGQAGYEAYWSAFTAVFERTGPAVRAEFAVLRELMERDVAARGLGPVPDVPIIVLVAAKYLPLALELPYDPHAHFEADLRHRIARLQEWTLASSRGTLVVASNTTHAMPREDPALIVWAVQRVLAALADGGEG